MFVYSLYGRSGQPMLAAIAKRSYRIHRGACVPEPTSPAIAVDPVHAPSENQSGSEHLVVDTDLFAPLKPSTDVLVRGSAHSRRGPVAVLDTAVAVGAMRKHIRVWGHRTIQVDHAGRLRFTASEPFESVPVTWDLAYGGRDMRAEHQRTASSMLELDDEPIVYPRNPSGRGFFLDRERESLEGLAAPRLEDPEDPVLPERLLARGQDDWLDRPIAACYGPVDWTCFPRSAFWIGSDVSAGSRPPPEMRRGVLRAEDLQPRPLGTAPDARAYNCAPAGLSGAQLRGDERVSLWNLHPRHEVWELALPGEPPRLFLQPPGCDAVELPARLQTVHIEPDNDRVTLTWTGTLAVFAPFPEEMCNAMRKAAQWPR